MGSKSGMRENRQEPMATAQVGKDSDAEPAIAVDSETRLTS